MLTGGGFMLAGGGFSSGAGGRGWGHSRVSRDVSNLAVHAPDVIGRVLGGSEQRLRGGASDEPARVLHRQRHRPRGLCVLSQKGGKH
eukprot:2175797-Pyramimonas_sp.AAC.1